MRIQLHDIDRPWFDADTIVELLPAGDTMFRLSRYMVRLNGSRVGWVHRDQQTGSWLGMFDGRGGCICDDPHTAAVAVCDEVVARTAAADAAATAEFEASKEA